MISNSRKTPQQTKQRQLTTCLNSIKDQNLSSILDSKINSQSSFECTTFKMSAMAAAASAEGRRTLGKSPMEAVVVNSIIYSKPSFCSISVDLGEMPVGKKSTLTSKLTNGSSLNNLPCISEKICSSTMDLNRSSSSFDAASCLAGLTETSSLGAGEDAKLYRMCTTLNGSINHQISDLCDNILVMAGFYGVGNNEHDDDSFIEFAYRNDGDNAEEDDEGDEDDFIDEDEYDYYDEADDDNDVVDFSYECPIEPAIKLSCDRKKKVRFNTTPTVYNMHTWSYAYRAARKGEWEMYARDRERFKLRIQRTAVIVNPVFEMEHRQKIYEKRFANLYSNHDSQNQISADIVQSKEIATSNESKKPHQKKQRKKRRYCKMGNKHYF